ncbi:hypothetical protein TrVE_jg6709 [Triparma verrucosa]|uniref:Uncharacterized protein n=1 Tax=Triparma verrucosa TaxID=1606542 RepID=A0A9W7CL96_9STRA|nr:hypothetical protein TrVE_jg6709 [Triparma verrucosa]
MSTRHINALRHQDQGQTVDEFDVDESSSESEVERRVDWTGLMDGDSSSSSSEEEEEEMRRARQSQHETRREPQLEPRDEPQEEDLDAILKPFINSNSSETDAGTDAHNNTTNPSFLFPPPPILKLNLPPYSKPYSPAWLSNFKSPPSTVPFSLPHPTLEQLLTNLYYHPTSLPTLELLLPLLEKLQTFSHPRLLLSLRYLCYLDRRPTPPFANDPSSPFSTACRILLLDSGHTPSTVESLKSYFLTTRSLLDSSTSSLISRDIISPLSLDYHGSPTEVLTCIESEVRYWSGTRDSESINFDKYIRKLVKASREKERKEDIINKKEEEVEEMLDRPLMYVFFWDMCRPYKGWKGYIVFLIVSLNVIDILIKLIFK